MTDKYEIPASEGMTVKGKDEILSTLGSLMNDRTTITLLHSTRCVRFLRTLRNVAQDDGKLKPLSPEAGEGAFLYL
jgi:hypothetical protein